MIRVDRGKVVGRPSPPAIQPARQADTRINLNTATAKELSAAIKGVGPANARDIIAHRKKRPFASLADCADRVGGVSVEQLEAANVEV